MVKSTDGLEFLFFFPRTLMRNKAANHHTDLPASHHHLAWNVEVLHN